MESLDAVKLADDAIQNPAKVRHIVSLLYNDDMERRFCAVKALGEIARRDPALMSQKWERIFRSFDDTMSCRGGGRGTRRDRQEHAAAKQIKNRPVPEGLPEG